MEHGLFLLEHAALSDRTRRSECTHWFLLDATKEEDVDDFKAVLVEAVEAATRGDLEALLMARMLLGHLQGQLQGQLQDSCAR
jgi:hypothetical protein